MPTKALCKSFLLYWTHIFQYRLIFEFNLLENGGDDDDNDDDDNDNGEISSISFSIYFLIFMFIAIITIVLKN